MRIDVITLFPGLYPGPLAESIAGRALSSGLADLVVHDLRDWGLGRHRSVDDYPYGGGAGMVLRPEPLVAALEAVAPTHALPPVGTERPDASEQPDASAPLDSTVSAATGAPATRILMDPGGTPFDQAWAIRLSQAPWLVLICPRYEGVDDRVRDFIDLELSVGDYIVSGGDLPALMVIDAVLRLLPGAIDPASTAEESFSEGLLEYPQFTRPAEFRGQSVPDVLLSGHHAEVARWRHAQAEARTRRVRPDLMLPRPASEDT